MQIQGQSHILARWISSPSLPPCMLYGGLGEELESESTLALGFFN